MTHQGTEEGEWYMPENLEELLSVLEHLPEGTKYRLVAGNTGTGNKVAKSIVQYFPSNVGCLF